jgi:hypothetical protein
VRPDRRSPNQDNLQNNLPPALGGCFHFWSEANMTIPSETAAPKNKGGRPFGTFGPKRRQQQLIKQYIAALGGDANLTPIIENNICRAVMLQSIAEGTRRRIDKEGASSANELLALARLEAVADTAVRRLKLPMIKINTRTDTTQ